MRSVQFVNDLDGENRLRVEFDVERGQVLSFVVQLEGHVEGAWQPIVRYDTAHGFAHVDVIRPGSSTQKVRVSEQDFAHALDVAMRDLMTNWSTYRRRFEQWLKAR
jgi:hypothetical protein